MCADWGYSTENGNVFAIIQTWHDPRMLCGSTLPELEVFEKLPNSEHFVVWRISMDHCEMELFLWVAICR